MINMHYTACSLLKITFKSLLTFFAREEREDTMPNTEPKLYKLQKKDLVACILRVFAKLVLFSFHRITMEGLEHLPKEGPALLLPKHCTYGRDVALEAIALHRATGRYANFLMRAIASRFYEWAGGIKIARPKDVRRVPSAQPRIV